jgi:hypothetical protein
MKRTAFIFRIKPDILGPQIEMIEEVFHLD